MLFNRCLDISVKGSPATTSPAQQMPFSRVEAQINHRHVIHRWNRKEINFVILMVSITQVIYIRRYSSFFERFDKNTGMKRIFLKETIRV